MSSLHTILLVAAIGAASGFLITLQTTIFSRLINQEWFGWQLTLRKFLFSTGSLGVLFGLGAWLLSVPSLPFYRPPNQTILFFAKIGLLVGFITPISGQVNRYFAARAEADRA